MPAWASLKLGIVHRLQVLFSWIFLKFSVVCRMSVCYSVTAPWNRWFSIIVVWNAACCLKGELECSEWSPLILGVPQGTIIGPIRFLIIASKYHNIIAKSLYPRMYILALQSYLDRLGEWANKWQLSFNPSKCDAMRPKPI